MPVTVTAMVSAVSLEEDTAINHINAQFCAGGSAEA